MDKNPAIDRESDTVVVADMDGALLTETSSFPYLALVAFEAGGVLRLLLLLLASPLAGALHHVSEQACVRVLVFATFAGMRVSDIEWAARAVLPKFLARDLRAEAWRVLASRGKRCVITAMPRAVVEPFLRECLGAEMVVGTEMGTWRGRATGLVNGLVLVGENKALALKKAFEGRKAPDICIAHLNTDCLFVKLCKERYIVGTNPQNEAITLPKPIVFHDGRLVQKPTVVSALLLVLWIPLGFALSCLRVATVCLLPTRLVRPALRALGVHIRVRMINGAHPPAKSNGQPGVLFVSSHRTLLDPVMLSAALGRPVPAVTYSLSRLSELISPIKLVRLTRHRPSDAATIKNLLEEDDLVICPEGTTCREPFLLRFSALFAELTDELVPVATACDTGVFHGTTARGRKGMDPYFFFMNPRPVYEVTVLEKLAKEVTCGGGGKTSHEVASYVQRVIATTLGFECTSLTRKDKYRVLVGNDGVVVDESNS